MHRLHGEGTIRPKVYTKITEPVYKCTSIINLPSAKKLKQQVLKLQSQEN